MCKSPIARYLLTLVVISVCVYVYTDMCICVYPAISGGGKWGYPLARWGYPLAEMGISVSNLQSSMGLETRDIAGVNPDIRPVGEKPLGVEYVYTDTKQGGVSVCTGGCFGVHRGVFRCAQGGVSVCSASLGALILLGEIDVLRPKVFKVLKDFKLAEAACASGGGSSRPFFRPLGKEAQPQIRKSFYHTPTPFLAGTPMVSPANRDTHTADPLLQWSGLGCCYDHRADTDLSLQAPSQSVADGRRFLSRRAVVVDAGGYSNAHRGTAADMGVWLGGYQDGATKYDSDTNFSLMACPQSLIDGLSYVYMCICVYLYDGGRYGEELLNRRKYAHSTISYHMVGVGYHRGCRISQRGYDGGYWARSEAITPSPPALDKILQNGSAAGRISRLRSLRLGTVKASELQTRHAAITRNYLYILGRAEGHRIPQTGSDSARWADSGENTYLRLAAGGHLLRLLGSFSALTHSPTRGKYAELQGTGLEHFDISASYGEKNSPADLREEAEKMNVVKLDPEQKGKIHAALCKGGGIGGAAKEAGVDRRTLWRLIDSPEGDSFLLGLSKPEKISLDEYESLVYGDRLKWERNGNARLRHRYAGLLEARYGDTIRRRLMSEEDRRLEAQRKAKELADERKAKAEADRERRMEAEAVAEEERLALCAKIYGKGYERLYPVYSAYEVLYGTDTEISEGIGGTGKEAEREEYRLSNGLTIGHRYISGSVYRRYISRTEAAEIVKAVEDLVNKYRQLNNRRIA